MRYVIKWTIFLILGTAFNIISLPILAGFLNQDQIIMVSIVLGIGELLFGITVYYAGKVET